MIAPVVRVILETMPLPYGVTIGPLQSREDIPYVVFYYVLISPVGYVKHSTLKVSEKLTNEEAAKQLHEHMLNFARRMAN